MLWLQKQTLFAQLFASSYGKFWREPLPSVSVSEHTAKRTWACITFLRERGAGFLHVLSAVALILGTCRWHRAMYALSLAHFPLLPLSNTHERLAPHIALKEWAKYFLHIPLSFGASSQRGDAGRSGGGYTETRGKFFFPRPFCFDL